MTKHGTISTVEKGSIAEQAGIEKGDVLLSVNGQNIIDIFDYRFLVADEKILVCIEKPDGQVWEIDIEKDQYEDIGLEFDPPIIDRERSCRNKCIFCFIDQLPESMRDTLYFKDDDARLSFLTGNYVTLTNTSDEELERIIKYKLSPVNISVHATDPDIRCKMMNNKFAGKIMNQIAHLTENNITVNCQLVICEGINDGDVMVQSIEDLAVLYPGVNSISVVPVGLTGHREKLFSLQPFDKEEALEIIHRVSALQNRYLKEKGSRIVFCADELYVIAGIENPGYDAYETFPQLENGVGLLAAFEKEFHD
ncbi:MAG TPA: radical SAM protein, partial [Clostridiales bacterium]|nr:radical SAM protein [Clostridiales bacterium]